MIPLKNLNPRRSFPIVTLLLIVANVLVFLHQVTLSPQANDVFIRTYGLVPAKIQLALGGHHYTLQQALTPLFTCMFLHGGFLHILGNMWFLWVFGGNVEDRLGPFVYTLFYLVCGIGSSATEMVFSWGTRVPSIGASGAISGILGAYVVFFPASRILTLVPLFIIWFTVRIPAIVFIGLWFIIQFLSGIGSLGMANNGGVAWWAHVGGFLIGLFLARGARQRPIDTWNSA
jgi:membrane associated rhomboid family serine protease